MGNRKIRMDQITQKCTKMTQRFFSKVTFAKKEANVIFDLTHQQSLMVWEQAHENHKIFPIYPWSFIAKQLK